MNTNKSEVLQPRSLRYMALIKWRLSLAVAFSAMAGFFLHSGDFSFKALIIFVGVFLMSGGAAALNQIQERKIDKIMSRTTNRPLPSSEIKFVDALIFALLCLTTGAILLYQSGWIPMALGLVNIVFYNLLYTPLKKVSIYAIIPGGIVGAIPPIIGWTAAGGSVTHPNIIYLGTLLFLWQIPHFWLLVIRHGKDYENAGFKSISSYLDEKQIKRLVFSWILISSVFLASYPVFGIHLDLIISIPIIILNIIFIIAFYWYLFKARELKKIKLAFILMNAFLVIILLMLILNSLIL